MARPIWKGHISFGLIHIPVTLYSGEKRNNIQLHLLDSRDQSRIRYERVNEETGEEVPWDSITRAYEYEKGQYLPIEEDELKELQVEGTKTVELDSFIDSKSLNCMYFDKPYIIEPEKNGDKSYVLLRETMREAKVVGIAKVVIRTRQYLAALMPVENAIVLNVMRFHQEIRSFDQFDLPTEKLSQYKVSKKEIDMAKSLVESMKTEWAPEEFHDEYREALQKFIDSKTKTSKPKRRTTKGKGEEAKGGEVIDIVGLLKKSLKEQKKRA